MHKSIKLIIIILLIHSLRVNGIEILYEEDFQSGVISEDWLFYGDPVSNINLDRGNPAPSFNNNGDSMGSSGIKTCMLYPIEEGIILEADIFISCHPRGTWVGIDIGFFNTLDTEDVTQMDMMPNQSLLFQIDYSGELAWMCPHLETVLGFFHKLQEIQMHTIIHANKYLNKWNKIKIEFSENQCNFFINDTLQSSFAGVIPDSLTKVGVFIGGRATSWGTALVDNLVVYRP